MKIFTGNQLKLIALITMTCDHVAYQLLSPDSVAYMILRIVGRLAFPLFTYMIAEGCRYTRNRKRYLTNILGLGIACQVVYFIAEGSLYQSTLMSFALSICMIYAIDYAKQKKNVWSVCIIACSVLGIWFLSSLLPQILHTTDYAIDYGFWGIMLPVIIYLTPQSYKVLGVMVGLLPLCIYYGGIQWYSYFAVLFLALYNGERGKINMKNVFYIYYPLHLVVIYCIGIL